MKFHGFISELFGPRYYLFKENVIILKTGKLVILIVLLISPFVIFGNNPGVYHFRKYTVENGLSNNSISSLMQDSKGFIWVGSRDGLNRFDGYNFKTFNFSLSDKNSLGGNFVHAIHEGVNGDIWVGTDKGLYRYDAQKETFNVLRSDLNYVRDIRSGQDGRLWFIAGKTFYTEMALYSYDEKNNKYEKYLRKDHSTITAICITEDGNIWCAASNGYLEKYDKKSNSFFKYNLYKRETTNEEKTIEKIYPIGNDCILIGTSYHGLKLFNTSTLNYKDIPLLNSDHSNAFIRDILKSSNDEFWIGTEGGIFIYNIKNDKYINLKKDIYDSYSISDNSVYALIKDREGGIWVGTFFGGLNYYPNQYNKFDTYYPINGKNSISGNIVREITSDNSGNLWIGTEDAGLNKFSPKNKCFKSYFKHEGKRSVSYSNIHGLLTTKNELWIGTFEHGLDRFNTSTENIFKHYSATGDFHSLKSNFIVAIKRTKENQILIGTYFGLYQYNNLKDNFDLVREVPDDAFVYTIYQDTQGTIWVGTIGDGVYYFNPDSKARGNINIESIKHNNRIRNNVIDIFEDSNRTLWFSTEGTGITSYSLLTQQFENFTVKDGLPSNLIFKVLEDKSRNLWMSTSNGLVCFNPLTKKAITYTKENGLLSNQFNYNSAFKDVDGTMYFGCLSGLISFNPDIFKSNGFIPKLFITGLMINNSEITAGASDSILKKSILFTKDIKLNYTQNSISLDFAALTYSEPEMVQYEYKLEDQDKIWTHLPHNRRVYFTNIPSGDYIFRVKAFNSSGLASNEVTLGIEILPPWWASKWAYCSYILLFLSLIYYISKSYHNIMLYTNEIKFAKHEYEKEQELHQMKIDFFTDVAHEIRTPLTLIIGPLETVVDRTRNIPELKSSLQFMEKNTRRLLDLTNQLLDFRSMEIRSFQLSFSKTDISVVLQDIFRSFEPLAKEANLAYEIVLPEKEILAEVDVEGIIKILNNLFSNAIKYSKSKIHVSLIYNEYESQFIIEMESDGDMIPENFQEKIFEPFFRMSENDHQNGTGIGLTISRTLAELHRGVLFLKKTKDKNINIFVLVIPILQVKEVE